MNILKIAGWAAGIGSWSTGGVAGVPRTGEADGTLARELVAAGEPLVRGKDGWGGGDVYARPQGTAGSRPAGGTAGRQLTQALNDHPTDTGVGTLGGLPATLAICQADPSGQISPPSRDTFARACLEALNVSRQPGGAAAVAAQLARIQVRAFAAAIGGFVARHPGDGIADLLGPDGDYKSGPGSILEEAGRAYPFGDAGALQASLRSGRSALPTLGDTGLSASGPAAAASADSCAILAQAIATQGAGAALTPPSPTVPVTGGISAAVGTGMLAPQGATAGEAAPTLSGGVVAGANPGGTAGAGAGTSSAGGQGSLYGGGLAGSGPQAAPGPGAV